MPATPSLDDGHDEIDDDYLDAVVGGSESSTPSGYVGAISATSATSEDRESSTSSGNSTLLPERVLSILGQIRDGEWLDNQQFPALRFVVPEIIAEGFTVLAGPPKMGKSYLILQVGIAAASGGKALGCLDVDARDVLYLALEDGDRRLQTRAREMLSGASIPKRLHRLLQVPPSYAGLVIRAWLDRLGTERACNAVVIVDTAQKVRPPSRTSSNAYESDYAFGSAMKAVADDYPGSALVALHHTRKMKSSDFVESSSGSNGFTGAADSIVVIERDRGSDDALLHVTGRDVHEAMYLIRRSHFGWELADHDLEKARAAAVAHRLAQGLGELQVDIMTFIAANPGCTPKQIREHVGDDDASKIPSYLARLEAAHRIVKTGRGQYVVAGDADGEAAHE